jgi:hypothetical protein
LVAGIGAGRWGDALAKPGFVEVNVSKVMLATSNRCSPKGEDRGKTG